MMTLDPILQKLLVCPDCRRSLMKGDESLACTSCGRRFEIRDGIPALYPQTLDLTHLAEEEHLAVQRTSEPTPLQKFRSAQWKLSKNEFWTMVENRINESSEGNALAGKSMINVGCGYDESFRPFQDRGMTFVNFDLVHCKLSQLKSVHGAKFCVLGDIRAMPFADSSFDYLVAIDVVHHEWRQIDRILTSFFDLIRPGGVLFLQEPNSSAVFQWMKSVLLPKPIHRALRKAYHDLKQSAEKPADYEFPTGMTSVSRLLNRIGFREVEAHGSYSYPCTDPLRYCIYQALSKSRYVRTYHNYHYTLSALKPLT